MTAPSEMGCRVRQRVQISASAHQGASTTSRELSSWNPFLGSADADLLPEREVLVSRSRDLVRNNGIASGAVDTLKDNVVGTGLRLRATPDWYRLGKDADWADEWGSIVESEWRDWAETTECDVSRTLNFHGLTGQIFRSGLFNGEGLALLLWLPRSNARYSTRIQLIEADRLSNPQFKVDDKTHRGGIDIDEYGAPIAYHIRRTHPGDQLFTFDGTPEDWVRVPAETEWGRKRVIHVHDRERTGATRGKPIFSSILSQFKMLDHYERTELQAAVVNAMVAAVIKTPLDSGTISQMFGGDPNDPKFQEYLSLRNEYTAPLKGGAVIPLYPGDEMQPFTPSRPAAAFGSFVETIIRQIGVGLNLPYELIAKNFSQTNYSSARAALLEAWRFFLGRRKWLSDYWASPVYEAWLEEAINAGRIKAPGFYENRRAYLSCKWVGSGRGWIDPVKEAEAALLRIEGGLSTLDDECAEQGKDWEEVAEQRFREKTYIMELEKKLGGVPLFGPPPKPQPQQNERQEAA